MCDRCLDNGYQNGFGLQPPRDRFRRFGNNTHELHFTGILNKIQETKTLHFHSIS